MNVTPSTAPLRVPARRCRPSLQLHRGERGHWRRAEGCPIPSLLRAIPSAPAPRKATTAAALCGTPPPQPLPPHFVSSQSVATKTPVKAKPGTGSLAGNAGRLGRFDKLQTARGERGRSAKTRRNGKWIREFKGGAEMGVPPKGKRTALETQWHPGGAGKGAYPYRVRAREPCPGTPGQSPLAMPQQGKPQHIQLAIAG